MATSKPEIIIDWAIKQINLPSTNSHKGQNGRLLVIGGSHIFHAASLWSAEIASKFIDLVHYSSTEENQQIFINLKSKFTNGIVIPRQILLDYVAEDDCILIGPGMERGNISEEIIHNELSFEKIIQLENEADYTYALIRHLIQTFPEKKFVFDAAALQVMDVEWLKLLKVKSVITPHSKEFEKLFKVKLVDDKHIITQVSELSKQYNTVILLKKVSDYIASNDRSAIITGGNEGLTKGGSGDALAGLVAALNTRNDQFVSSILASYLVKLTSERIYEQKGSFYNTSDLIASIPLTAGELLY